ncbi:MAG: glycosyltransferase family 4 protein [Chloroflexi bacterium]|nr:glycosyltransferase family 4 protein [Chloroflexota bacterium]MCY3582605.1 glycosyltransferase family 4 protein [Chloroflexota bacterium]MCY3714856.1 glycosyltransferase family 4 protein [Chloroflexota bacterium]MDE2651755.1 glycosyltransferase family 4 protein [Chloroflexota bacterium]
MARELHKRGISIDLLALYDRADDPQHIDKYRPYFRHIRLIPEPPRSNLSYLRRLLLPGARFANRPESSFCPPLWGAIAECLRHNKYDLAHCFGSFTVYEYLPLFAHLPKLITPYESHSLYLRSAAQQGNLLARIRLPLARRYEQFMFSPYDRTVLISDVDAAMLRDLQPGLRVAVIPNGVDLAQFRPTASDRDRNSLVFVGNFAYAPNQDAARLLIERLLPAVRAKLPAARLQLVGANPPDWLRELANEHIEVTGRVADVAPYLSRAALFVCPLRIGAGMKNKVLEALAMGVPVVATPLSVDGIAARHQESAWIAPVDQLAAAAIRLLQDEALRVKLSQNGRQLIEARYTWARTADAYARLYAEICAAR